MTDFRSPRSSQQNPRKDFVERLKEEMELQPPALQPRPLPPDLRHEFEIKLAQDLSNVRVCETPAVSNLCKGAGAQAFAQGFNIFFSPGKYQPHSLEGKAQLMHEILDAILKKDAPEAASDKPKKAASQAPESELIAAVRGKVRVGVRDWVSGNKN
jgi:hypothetical protein